MCYFQEVQESTEAGSYLNGGSALKTRVEAPRSRALRNYREFLSAASSHNKGDMFIMLCWKLQFHTKTCFFSDEWNHYNLIPIQNGVDRMRFVNLESDQKSI